MRPAQLVESYLSELRACRSAGVAETSFYPPLAKLLDSLGKDLKPKVQCVVTLKNTGAGIPDAGLFTSNSLRRAPQEEIFRGIPPDRGALEAKAPAAEVAKVAKSEQVARYAERYGLVLVTTFREFILVGWRNNQTVNLESFSLASSEEEFWDAAGTPHTTASALGERFVEYLRRVMLHNAPIASPEGVAWFLASYARDARARVELAMAPVEDSHGPISEDLASKPITLDDIRSALEEALGLRFETPKGQHFFRSTLVQTLFYGVFSAWVLWHRGNPARRDAFDWRTAAFHLRVPVLRKLFHAVADPAQLQTLNLVEVLDWAAAALNRVDRAAFFTRFEDRHAVQYFYEPFLEAFDPELRKDLGVWYTPEEIVRYQVARVDTALREELGLADGLADPSVVVLDPCCGTGAYLVEVLQRIAATLKERRGDDALVATEVRKAATQRIFGFEILPAPFVISHLQIGLLLAQLGAPFSEKSKQRAGVFLTNALTGWDPPKEPKNRLMAFEELQEERDAANKVKRSQAVLVVLGNPPYNAFAGTSPAEEKGLVDPYKEGLIREWGIKKFNLDDLYIRFFRLAERRIAEMSGRGVVSFISNHSWISDPSFVVLRKRLLESFDSFWIENMHGNRKISEYAPDGRTSETIFALPGFSPGIQQGVAISLWVKCGRKGAVRFRDDLNAARATERRAQLLESLEDPNLNTKYEEATPTSSNRFAFRRSEVSEAFASWPRLLDLCAEPPSNGLMEKRGGALMDLDRTALERRMRAYLDPAVSWDRIAELAPSLTEDAARFDARATRGKVVTAEHFEASRLRRYALRPFDTRWCYYSPTRPLWNEPRPRLWSQCWEGNSFLLTRLKASTDPEGIPLLFTRCLSDDHTLTPDAVAIPLHLRSGPQLAAGERQGSLFEGTDTAPKANLSKFARDYLASFGLPDPDRDVETAALLWMHALAVGFSPAWLKENAEGIRRDWPRIPLPSTKEALLASAELGKQVATLLDTETPVPGLTSGKIRPELKQIAVIRRVGKGNLNPDDGDLDLTAGWGRHGKEGIVMPGRGRLVERDATEAEFVEELGRPTCDVSLNGVAYWQNIPLSVWEFTLGGYQVIKKWLSYREKPILGRSLTVAEVQEVTDTARRLAAVVLLRSRLDENYKATQGVS